MEIVISGAGQVGTTVAQELMEDHSITVIDRDPEQLDELSLSINAVCGNAVEIDTLREAGVEDADILINCTADDRTNILACSTANIISNVFKMARVSTPSYLETWQSNRRAFHVDWIVSRSYLSAKRMIDLIGLQSSRESALEVEYFAEGRIQMAEFQVTEGAPIQGQKIQEADQYQTLTFCAIFRNNELIIPDGNNRIQSNDRLVVIGHPHAVTSFGTDVHSPESPDEIEHIAIFGGGTIGYQVATILADRNLHPVILERDNQRARYLAESLPNALVLKGDARNTDFWKQEQLDESDLVLSATRPDDQNLLLSLMAKSHDIPLVVSVVHLQKYLSAFQNTDIDRLIHPRNIVADEIIQYIQKSKAEKITTLEQHKGKIIELVMDSDSPYIGSTIQETCNELPGELVIGAIQRDARVIAPRGSTRLETGDHLVILSDEETADNTVEQL